MDGNVGGKCRKAQVVRLSYYLRRLSHRCNRLERWGNLREFLQARYDCSCEIGCIKRKRLIRRIGLGDRHTKSRRHQPILEDVATQKRKYSSLLGPWRVRQIWWWLKTSHAKPEKARDIARLLRPSNFLSIQSSWDVETEVHNRSQLKRQFLWEIPRLIST